MLEIQVFFIGVFIGALIAILGAIVGVWASR